MENTAAHDRPTRTDNNANRTEHYVTLIIAIAIGLIGVFIRFVPDVVTALDQLESLFSWIANIALLVASYIAFKVVFEILGFGKNK